MTGLGAGVRWVGDRGRSTISSPVPLPARSGMPYSMTLTRWPSAGSRSPPGAARDYDLLGAGTCAGGQRPHIEAVEVTVGGQQLIPPRPRVGASPAVSDHESDVGVETVIAAPPGQLTYLTLQPHPQRIECSVPTRATAQINFSFGPTRAQGSPAAGQG